jgi:hypothetical protein
MALKRRFPRSGAGSAVRPVDPGTWTFGPLGRPAKRQDRSPRHSRWTRCTGIGKLRWIGCTWPCPSRHHGRFLHDVAKLRQSRRTGADRASSCPDGVDRRPHQPVLVRYRDRGHDDADKLHPERHRISQGSRPLPARLAVIDHHASNAKPHPWLWIPRVRPGSRPKRSGALTQGNPAPSCLARAPTHKGAAPGARPPVWTPAPQSGFRAVSDQVVHASKKSPPIRRRAG